jgi:hypothetical protein
MPPATLHAVLGMAVALPLAVHLWQSARRKAGAIVLGLVPVALVGSLAVRGCVPPEPVLPNVPAFAYATRDVTLYDGAAWCGSCHTTMYEEWRRSTHARTFELPTLRHELGVHHDLLGLDMDAYAIMSTGNLPPGMTPNSPAVMRATEPCIHCHAPMSFYGKDDSDPLENPSPQTKDAVGCAFCHTLRANRVPQIDVAAVAPEGKPPAIGPTAVNTLTLAISAPETVRRYLGQASSNAVLRWVGDLLIQWRPDMHRHDYHSPVLDTSEVCRSCHGMPPDDPRTSHRTFVEWQRSAYNTAAPEQRVNCQDCHMTRDATGTPKHEPGRLVPWGPERPQRRSHLFLGGNASFDITLGDRDLAELQHALNARAVLDE